MTEILTKEVAIQMCDKALEAKDAFDFSSFHDGTANLLLVDNDFGLKLKSFYFINTDQGLPLFPEGVKKLWGMRILVVPGLPVSCIATYDPIEDVTQ